MIDELRILKDDLMIIREGGISKIEKTLSVLTTKFKLVWIAMSTSSLINVHPQSDAHPNNDDMTRMLHQAGYQVKNLSNVMRTTRTLAGVADPQTYWKLENDLGIYSQYSGSRSRTFTSAVSSGISSTIIGSKPTALLYNPENCENYQFLAKCVQYYIKEKNLNVSKSHIAVLFGSDEDEHAAEKMSIKEMYDELDILLPRVHCCSDQNDQKDVLEWMENGGVLLTHGLQFRGCEADVVIVIWNSWTFWRKPIGSKGNYSLNYHNYSLWRYPVTRATALVCWIGAVGQTDFTHPDLEVWQR